MKISSKTITLFLLTLALVALPARAQIINDLFNQAPSGGITSLSGKAPNTNVPGATWTTQGGGFTAENAPDSFLGSFALTGAPGTNVPYAFVNGDQATISLAGSNSGTLTLSAYMNNASGGDGSLGFSNVAAGAGGFVFNGFNIDNAGDLTETLNGVTSSAIAFGGTYDPSSLSLLSFTVNTASGNITSVSFQNSTADYSSFVGVGAIGATQTAFLAMKGSTVTRFADLTLSSTVAAPEPSTWTMLATGFVLLLGVLRLRSRQLSR